MAIKRDPWGTGDLVASSGNNIIRLGRDSATDGDWQGTVTVWECLTDAANAGFRLVDVKGISFGAAAAGSEQTATVTTGSNWGSLAQVAIYSGGSTTSSGGNHTRHSSLHAKLTPSGTATLTGSRWGGSAVGLVAADFTVYVVEWGSEHQIQRVVVTGTAGGADVDSTGEYNATAISTKPLKDSPTELAFVQPVIVHQVLALRHG